MPRKVRPLIADLEKAGFVNRAAKALAAGESLNSYCIKTLAKA